jgi:hypothetical protein
VNRIIVLTVDKICASMHEGVDDAACFRLVSELDVRVVMLVHQKSAPSRKSFGSMSVICHAFYTDLMAKLNIPPSACPSPWPAPAAKPVETKASSSKPMMKITASGKVDLPTLHQLGFHIGVLVVSAAQTHYVIKAMSEDWVELAPPGGVHERVHHAVLVDDYTLVPKEEHEQIILGKDHDAAASPDIVLEVAKSKLRIALAAAFRDHSSRVDVQRQEVCGWEVGLGAPLALRRRARHLGQEPQRSRVCRRRGALLDHAQDRVGGLRRAILAYACHP